MTTESLLVKTKDNHVIVFSIEYSNAAEKMRITTQCQNACKDKTFSECYNSGSVVVNADIDYKNTEFLQKEISGYHFRKEPAEYRNDLNTANMPPCPDDTIQFDYTVPDNSVPEVFKNIGGKITTKDCTYDVYFDGEEYVARDFKKTTAIFYENENKIEIVRNQFHFPPQEYAELQTMIRRFESARAANPNLNISDFMNGISDRKSKSLFKIYADEYKRVQHHDKTIAHEIKHLKNKVFYDGLSIKNDVKRLSVEDCYCLSVENERSAYLEQLVNGINKYLKCGNYNDYSMFDEFSGDFAQKLKNCASDEERMAMATNMNAIVDSAIKKFNAAHKESYDNGQFVENTRDMAKQQPVTAPEDTDRAWFKKIRSMYYNFEIYNPQTGRMEHRNLAQYIKPELEVSAENYVIEAENGSNEADRTVDIVGTIINPAKDALQEKINNISDDAAQGKINTSLVGMARALMRDSVNQSAFLNEIDNFRIASLYDNSYNYDPNLPPQPEIPSDHADWSDDLQRYWQQVDGYHEIAKNNLEYKFAVNNATISYKNRYEAEISDNAGYDLYVKMLAEPTNKARKVEFMETLTEEQALTLYVACINSGRVPTGKVPTDLSKIERMSSIPEAAKQTFRQRMSQSQPQHQANRTQNSRQNFSAQQLRAIRQYSGR
ncbi:MAG: hypothetical protein IJ778_00225 [Alphaproteobacteria bacterium]|nr:hypothetical protein [Alphaproteobacteria bacterium]